MPKKEFDFLVKNRLAIEMKKGYLMYKQNNLFKQVEYKETNERGAEAAWVPEQIGVADIFGN